MKLPNPTKQFITPGVRALCEKTEGLGDLWADVIKQYKKEPDLCTDGGNDKEFFSFVFRKTKLFVAANEIGGLTVMLPSEY